MTRLLLTLLLLGNVVLAQDFGKNATWFRWHQYGAFKCFHNGDTVILGKTCRRITHQIYVRPNLPPSIITQVDDLYLYDTADTVFVYNDLYNRFTPLYVFNVLPGDTVTIPALPMLGRQWLGPVGDSSWQYVVDSVKDVLYDTTLLQTVYSHTLYFPNRARPAYEWFSAVGPNSYARKIGGVGFGLLPRCSSCYEILIDGTGLPAELFCYSDSAAHIQLVTECDAGGFPLATPSLSGPEALEIFPNLVSDVIQLKNPAGSRIKGTRITDPTGKLIRSDDLSVKDLPNGLYFISVQFAEKTVTRTIVVRH